MESQFTFDLFEPFEESLNKPHSSFFNDHCSANSVTLEGFPFGFSHHDSSDGNGSGNYGGSSDAERQDHPFFDPFNRGHTIFLMRNESSGSSPETHFKHTVLMDFISPESNDLRLESSERLQNQLNNNGNHNEDYISVFLEKEETETGKYSPSEEGEEKGNGQQTAQICTKGVKSRRKQFKKESHTVALTASKGKTKKKRTNESKNAAKNYGKAIAAFCLSEIGRPYLQERLQLHQVQLEDFKTFVINKKETIESIDTFRELLTPDREHDTLAEMKSKLVFKDLSEVFIRDFAVNWIFSSRIRYRETHLNLRCKMLRRVRNPHYFTYLQSF